MSVYILRTLALIFLMAQILASLKVIWRIKRGTLRKSVQAVQPVTIIRPICGLEHRLEDCLRTSFSKSNTVQVIFCASNPHDPAIPLVEALIKAHPNADALLHIGEALISGNPKLNNMAGVFDQAKHKWVLMVDSNVLLSEDYVEQLFSHWDEDAGLVSSPAQAIDLQNTAAHFEAAFLNINQARLQLLADEFNFGFTQGKLIFWRQDILEKGGGLVALGHELAEDIASTKLVRKQGLRIRLLNMPVPQPLGQRDLKTVWLRQLRWARVRRVGMPWIYAIEIINGALVPMTLLILSGAGLGMILLYIALWYGSEWALARVAGWSRGLRDVALWVLRDVSLPIIWVQGYLGSHFEWRGNYMRKEGEKYLLESAQEETM